MLTKRCAIVRACEQAGARSGSLASSAWFAQRCFDVWPTYRTFVRDGHKRLHAALMRHGGPERWAGELGVPRVAQRRGRRLSDDEIRDALRALLREHRPSRFPSQAWLREHGPAGLSSAVKSSGGTQRWANEFGMPATKQSRWTDERIERELRRLCAGTARWPTPAEFRAGRMRRAIQRRVSRARKSLVGAAARSRGRPSAPTTTPVALRPPSSVGHSVGQTRWSALVSHDEAHLRDEAIRPQHGANGPG